MQNGMLGVYAAESIQFRILHTAFSQIIASIPARPVWCSNEVCWWCCLNFMKTHFFTCSLVSLARLETFLTCIFTFLLTPPQPPALNQEVEGEPAKTDSSSLCLPKLDETQDFARTHLYHVILVARSSRLGSW